MARRKLNIDDLPSNNKTTPNRPREIESIVDGRAHTGKGRGLASDVQNIGNSLFEEIILPAVKSAVVDFFSSGVNMVVFGQGASDRSSSRHRSYNRMYDRRRPSRDRTQSRNRRHVEEVFEDVYFDNRNDAMRVLARMIELTDDYGWATVGDLNQLVGLPSNYTYERYGWEDVRRCGVRHTSEGYIINFPEPKYLK